MFSLLRISAFAILAAQLSCTFKFDLTSQRTALENQILGRYEEAQVDIALSSEERSQLEEQSRRAASTGGSQSKIDAKENRKYNVDDINELKDLQILGESSIGEIRLLPKGKGLVDEAEPSQLKLAELLVVEENRDRAAIWRQTIAGNLDLDINDLEEVKSNFSNGIRKKARTGHWFQERNGEWIQKQDDR